MSGRPSVIARACLEGLAGGAAAGALLLALERSPTFHIYADVLNAIFRSLAGRIDEATLVRTDTEAVAFATYVGGHALLGAVLGITLGITFFRTRPTGRVVALAALISAVDAFVFGAVWWHRALPLAVGAGIVVATGIVVVGVAATTGRLLDRALPRPALGVLAWVAFAGATGASLWTVVAAGRPRPSPDGPVVQDATRADTGVKVAILGLDGLDWYLVEEAFAEGRLPNLARLVENGTRGDLRSIRPPKSPVVWTSIATGMLPSEHGIRHFVVRRDGRNVPVTGNLREVPALWNIAESARFTVAFVNWYVTWPAEPVPGLMISDRVDFDGLDRRVYPETLTASVDSVRAAVDFRSDRGIARFTRVGGDFDEWRSARWGQVRRALGILDDVVRHDLVTLESTRLALRSGQPSLTALYFRGTDNTQHLFWKYRLAQGRGPGLASWIYDDLEPSDARLLGAVIERYYDFIDELVGETLGMLEPDTAILVLSDHGFLTNNERSRWYHPNRLLAAAGLCVLRSAEGGAADSSASVVLDPGPPTINRIRVLRPGGRAGNPTDALVLARAALGKVHLDSGAPVFEALSIESDGTGPFLTAVFAPILEGSSAFLDGTEIPLAEFTVPEGHSGDHRMNGLLIASGGPFRRGAQLEGARAVDVAPTVLHLLGAPAALDMEGVVLTDLVDPAWLKEHPVSYVPSYGRRETSGEVIATDADDEIRRELEALGYIR
jgi:predicted AlkP superfamily phosphohydrolase/phosphomutase